MCQLENRIQAGATVTAKKVTILITLLPILLGIALSVLTAAILREWPESVTERVLREMREKEEITGSIEEQEKLQEEVGDMGEEINFTVAEINELIEQKNELIPLERILILSDLGGQSEEFKKLAQLYLGTEEEFARKSEELGSSINATNHRVAEMEGADVLAEFHREKLRLANYQKYFTEKNRYFLQTIEKLRSLASPELQKKVNKYYRKKLAKEVIEEMKKRPEVIDPQGVIVKPW